ncbi:hypothetical protein FHR36_004038 [Kitasatospora paracochleata]|uniref:Transposase n=1 Tax=Kitasatospora paracochleata TaxID=58354 RepID=A0ABT1J0C5_9ACTN|nr:hypothetical protein [Kitasatospora paracochleata]
MRSSHEGALPSWTARAGCDRRGGQVGNPVTCSRAALPAVHRRNQGRHAGVRLRRQSGHLLRRRGDGRQHPASLRVAEGCRPVGASAPGGAVESSHPSGPGPGPGGLRPGPGPASRARGQRCRLRADGLLRDQDPDQPGTHRDPRGPSPAGRWPARRGVPHGSGLGVHRWVVDSTIARLHGFRRLRIRWERRDDIHEAFLGLATCLITHRHVQRLGTQSVWTAQQQHAPGAPIPAGPGRTHLPPCHRHARAECCRRWVRRLRGTPCDQTDGGLPSWSSAGTSGGSGLPQDLFDLWGVGGQWVGLCETPGRGSGVADTRVMHSALVVRMRIWPGGQLVGSGMGKLVGRGPGPAGVDLVAVGLVLCLVAEGVGCVGGADVSAAGVALASVGDGAGVGESDGSVDWLEVGGAAADVGLGAGAGGVAGVPPSSATPAMAASTRTPAPASRACAGFGCGRVAVVRPSASPRSFMVCTLVAVRRVDRVIVAPCAAIAPRPGVGAISSTVPGRPRPGP